MKCNEKVKSSDAFTLNSFFFFTKFWEQLPSAWLNWRLILPHLPTICPCKYHQGLWGFFHFWFQNWFNSFLDLHSGQTKSTGKHLQTSSKELPATKIKANPFLCSGKWERVTPLSSLQCRNPTLPTAARICVYYLGSKNAGLIKPSVLTFHSWNVH